MKRTVILGQIAPIPVGHAVEVTPIKDETAYVRDLDTGIEYLPYNVVSKSSDCSYFIPRLYVEQFDTSALDRSSTFKGKVSACRVGTLSMVGFDAGFVTRLVVEVE